MDFFIKQNVVMQFVSSYLHKFKLLVELNVGGPSIGGQ